MRKSKWKDVFEDIEVIRAVLDYDPIRMVFVWAKREPWVYERMPKVYEQIVEELDGDVEQAVYNFNNRPPEKTLIGKEPVWYVDDEFTTKAVKRYFMTLDRSRVLDAVVADAFDLPVDRVRQIAERCVQSRRLVLDKKKRKERREKKRKLADSVTNAVKFRQVDEAARVFMRKYRTAFYTGRGDDRSALNSYLYRSARNLFTEGMTEEQVFDAIKTDLGGTRDDRQPLSPDSS